MRYLKQFDSVFHHIYNYDSMKFPNEWTSSVYHNNTYGSMKLARKEFPVYHNNLYV
jgi:hypothetical protein